MIQGQSVLAIVPARGGSKQLPGKNIKPLHGRPLIAWTIEAARQSQAVDRVLVSTDAPAIADVARREGAGSSTIVVAIECIRQTDGCCLAYAHGVCSVAHA